MWVIPNHKTWDLQTCSITPWPLHDWITMGLQDQMQQCGWYHPIPCSHCCPRIHPMPRHWFFLRGMHLLLESSLFESYSPLQHHWIGRSTLSTLILHTWIVTYPMAKISTLSSLLVTSSRERKTMSSFSSKHHPDHGRLISGYGILNVTQDRIGGVHSWCSKKQISTTLSTHEAECISSINTGHEVVWECELHLELGFVQKLSTWFLTDNNSALWTINSPNQITKNITTTAIGLRTRFRNRL